MHSYIVTVTDCTEEQANQVMAERLEHDEDLGFTYHIAWHSEERELELRSESQPTPEPVHLLRTRGESQCGADWIVAMTPEINEVTCPECLKQHDELTAEEDEDV